MIQEHSSYDEETTDFVDPLRLSDQAVFRDGAVLAWSRTDGWGASRGEHCRDHLERARRRLV
jgi:hypothetical protein